MTKFFKLLTIALGLGLIALPAQAYEKGDWIIRGGVGMVSPESTAYVDSTDDLRISVDDGTSAVISATYMFSSNFGFEVLAAWPFSHDIMAGSADGSAELKIGETKHLPPTLTFTTNSWPERQPSPTRPLSSRRATTACPSRRPTTTTDPSGRAARSRQAASCSQAQASVPFERTRAIQPK